MKRPTPARVQAILFNLIQTQQDSTVPELVAAIMAETGCSRATAYRAISDALTAGTVVIERAAGQRGETQSDKAAI